MIIVNIIVMNTNYSSYFDSWRSNHSAKYVAAQYWANRVAASGVIHEEPQKDYKERKIYSNLSEIWMDGFEEHYGDVPETSTKLRTLNLPRMVSCSSTRKGLFHGRNFDFTYDNMPTHIMHVGKTDKNQQFLCVVKNMVGNALEVKSLPNFLVDGINESEVCVNINVVPEKDLINIGLGNTKGTKPGARRVHQLCVPCMILAEATSAVDAVERMLSVDIYGDLIGLEYVHYMISDKDDTFVVEIIGDKVYVMAFSSNVH